MVRFSASALKMQTSIMHKAKWSAMLCNALQSRIHPTAERTAERIALQNCGIVEQSALRLALPRLWHSGGGVEQIYGEYTTELETAEKSGK